MITSFLEGRIRLRCEALKDPNTLGDLAGLLNGQDGVLSVESNLRTGSLLVLYDPSKIRQQDIEDLLPLLEDKLGPMNPPAKKKRKKPCIENPMRMENFMLASAVVSGLSLVAGNTALHKITGGAFFVLAARHIYRRRWAWI